MIHIKYGDTLQNTRQSYIYTTFLYIHPEEYLTQYRMEYPIDYPIERAIEYL